MRHPILRFRFNIYTSPQLGFKQRALAWTVLCLCLAFSPDTSHAEMPPLAHAQIHYERAARAFRAGDHDEAVKNLERALVEDPKNQRVLSLYGRSLIALGRNDEALSALTDLHALNPNSPNVNFFMAIASFRLGQFKEARDHLLEAQATAPEDGRIPILLSRTYQELGDSESAELALDEAARIDDSLAPQVAYRRGVLAMEREDQKSALQFFDEVQRQIPNSELAQSAESYLRSLHSLRENPWTAYTSLGFFLDTNATLAGQGPLGGQRERDYFASLDFGVSRKLIEKDHFQLVAGVDGGLNYHLDISDVDVERTRGWLAASLLSDGLVAVDFRYELEGTWADFSRFRRNHSIEPALRLRWSDQLVTRFFWRFSDAAYFRTSSRNSLDRDGQISLLGIDQFLPIPAMSWTRAGEGFLRLGYRHRTEETQGAEFDSSSQIAILSAGIPLSPRFALLLGLNLERRHHAKRSLFEPSAGNRLDRIMQSRVALRHAPRKNVTLEISWRRTRWASNVDSFDFGRHIIGLSTTLRFD